MISFRVIKFLSEEMVLNAFKGKKPRVDTIIKAKLKPSNERVIIHIEPYSYVQKTLKGVCTFATTNYLTIFNCPIAPIFLYTLDSPQNTISNNT